MVLEKLIRQSIKNGTYYNRYRNDDWDRYSYLDYDIYDIRLVEEQEGTGVSMIRSDGLEYRFAPYEGNEFPYNTPEKLLHTIKKYAGHHSSTETFKYAATYGIIYYRYLSKIEVYERELFKKYNASLWIGKDEEFFGLLQAEIFCIEYRHVHLPFSILEKMASDASVAERYEASIAKLEPCPPDREDIDPNFKIRKVVGLKIFEKGDELFWQRDYRIRVYR